jgi:hypothetical protein
VTWKVNRKDDKTTSLGCPSKMPSPGGGNACAGSRTSLLSFEEKINGNFLKLLSLDNDADEEKYRRATEKTISPNLPIIRPGELKFIHMKNLTIVVVKPIRIVLTQDLMPLVPR